MKIITYVMILLSLAASVFAGEPFKYTDRNGITTWLDDKSKIPPQMPVQYMYVDKNGITFWVDDENKIPPEYRNNNNQKKPAMEKKALEKRQYSTKINITNNQIIVPVIFKNKGRKVKARMILDTGASVTTLYSVLASELHLKKNRLTRVKSMNANGVTSDSLLTKVDYIEVDDKILANPEVVVIPSHTNIGADGLLGNSFLRFFNFTIDYENQLLRWN